MKRTTIDYLIEGTGGSLYAAAADGAYSSVDHVSIDSRCIEGDCLFFCIIGARVDAHAFLEEVRERGCHNVVVSDVSYAEKMKEHGDMNVILVSDTTRALMNLAEKYLDDWPGLIKVGVTGSVGKTSTKEFTAAVLSSSRRTGKTPGNLNSEFGIPLTIFSFEPDIEIAVIEMGVGYGSCMADLSAMVKPDIAIVTTVGSSHMEVFGSREGLVREKLGIAAGMKDGVLIVNTDCDVLDEETVRRNIPESVEVRTIGTSGCEDYVLSAVEDRGIDGVECDLESVVDGAPEKLHMTLPVIGAHNLANAALAVAAGGALGVGFEKAVASLADTEWNANRLEVMRGGGVTVINDTYNASPESMKAGLKVLAASAGTRRVAVLGSMFELGEDSEELHRSVGQAAADCGIDLLITVGENALAIAEGAELARGDRALPAVIRYENREKALSEIKEHISAGDVILVKASNSMRLNEISKLLTEQMEQRCN